MEGKITYKQYLDAYKDGYSDSLKETQYRNAQQRWNDLKSDEERLQKDYLALKAKINKNKSRSLSAWIGYSSAPKKSKVSHTRQTTMETTATTETKETTATTETKETTATTASDVIDLVEVTEGEGEEATSGDNVVKISKRETPAQNKLEVEINNLKTQFHSLVTLQQTGLSSVDKKQIDEVKESIKAKELKLNRLKSEAIRMKKRRQNYRKV